MSVRLFRFLWKTGSRWRNPGFKVSYRFLKATEKLTLNELKEIQFQRLKETLVFAYQNTEYYNEIFKKVSFIPERDFNSLNDINKVPLTTKYDLLQYNVKVHSRAKFNRVFKSESSGTSGQELKFLKDETWDSFNRAARFRGFSWYGVNPWERNGYLWGYNFAFKEKVKTFALDKLQNRFRLFSYNEKGIKHFIKKLEKATYLSGYSSMIYEIARRINSYQNKPELPGLKVICGTSEKIFDSYQPETLKAFGKRIVSEYGSAESGIIAFECPYGNMHINMEGVYVEEVDNEIIITNLIARSFPVIRYKLGDYIKLKDPGFECPCGMKHPIIEDVIGRVGKLVYGFKETYPSLTFYYVFKNLSNIYGLELNYQVSQENKGELIVKTQQDLPTEHLKLLENELIKYFKTDMTFKIIPDQELHEMNGKFVDFITTVE